MRWVPDHTGRLPQRPHFEADEIDREGEALLAARRRVQRGGACFPLSTDDLTVLLEQLTSDLDLYADLRAEGPSIEGVTEFLAKGAPRVRIARELSEAPERAHRLRSTLAHELGHVHLHACLWALAPPAEKPMLEAALARQGTIVSPRQPGRKLQGAGPAYQGSASGGSAGFRCRRETIVRAGRADWLEWQAGYFSGALLMPATTLARLAEGVLAGYATRPPVEEGTPAAAALIRRVQAAFDVSREAARVRLHQRGYLALPAPPRGATGRHRRAAPRPLGVRRVLHA